jgi:ketosteroid isomerase-like protein
VIDEAAVRRLLDESEIRALLARYARAIDRMDWELLRSVYHDDAVDVHAGREWPAGEFAQWLQGRLGNYVSTKHFLGNQLIEVDGDTAWAETYCLALHRNAAVGDEPAFDRLVSVRYCDRLERRGGEWRIAHRIVAYEPGRIDPVGAEPELTPTHVRGSRDRDDPAYRRLREQG